MRRNIVLILVSITILLLLISLSIAYLIISNQEEEESADDIYMFQERISHGSYEATSETTYIVQFIDETTKGYAGINCRLIEISYQGRTENESDMDSNSNIIGEQTCYLDELGFRFWITRHEYTVFFDESDEDDPPRTIQSKRYISINGIPKDFKIGMKFNITTQLYGSVTTYTGDREYSFPEIHEYHSNSYEVVQKDEFEIGGEIHTCYVIRHIEDDFLTNYYYSEDLKMTIKTDLFYDGELLSTKELTSYPK